MQALSYQTALALSALPTPSVPLQGALVRLTTDNKPYWCDGSTWIDLSAVGGGGSGGGVTISDTAPASPTAGALWWNSSDPALYIYYADGTSSQWVDAVSGVASVPGLPAGGAANQVLSKVTANDFDTAWVEQPSVNTHLLAVMPTDTVLTAFNTWYTAATLTLTKGVWLVTGNITHLCTAATAETITGRVRANSTTFAETAMYHAAVANSGVSLSMSCIIEVPIGVSYGCQLQGASSMGGASSAMKAATALDLTVAATRLTAVFLRNTTMEAPV